MFHVPLFYFGFALYRLFPMKPPLPELLFNPLREMHHFYTIKSGQRFEMDADHSWEIKHAQFK
jgi:hypothetical protein